MMLKRHVDSEFARLEAKWQRALKAPEPWVSLGVSRSSFYGLRALPMAERLHRLAKRK